MGETYRVRALPNPLSFTEEYTSDFAVGGTILDALPALAREPGGWSFQVDGVPVPADRWEVTRPGAGQLVVLRKLPRGKVLRIILPILVLVISFFVAPYLAASLGIATNFGIAAVRLGLTILGNLLVNALVPPPKPPKPSGGGPDFQELATITGTSNQVNPFGPIPRLYGTKVFYPLVPTTATAYTELEGDDQFLRMFLCLGYGPQLLVGGLVAGAGLVVTHESSGFDHDAIKIGTTSILDYNDVEFEIGAPEDLTLFTNRVFENTLSVSLPPSNLDPWDPDDKHGDIDLVDTATATRTTEPGAREFSVELDFPQGLYCQSTKGKVGLARVTFKLYYRRFGSGGAWTTVDDDWRIESKQRKTLRVGRRVKLPFVSDETQYDVRIDRVHTFAVAQPGGAIACDWTALRSIFYHRAFVVPNTVCLAVRLRATDQLKQIIQNLSVRATAILQVYDGHGWSWQPTNSAAWAYVDLLTGVANARPLSRSDVNVEAMVAWAARLEELGFEYNRVHDQPETTFEAMQEVAAAGLAAWAWEDGLVTVVQDVVDDDLPVGLVTPRNSSGFQVSREFLTPPHALRVQFSDPETGEQTERLVYNDGYSASGSARTAPATLFESLDAVGCTDPDQAWKFGRYHLAQARLRNATYSWQTGWEFLSYRRGALLEAMHDVIAVSLGWARVKEVSLAGELTLDDDVVMEEGVTYGARVRVLDDDGVVTPRVVGPVRLVTAPGVGRVLTPVDPAAVAAVEVDDLVGWGKLAALSTLVKVTSIQPDLDLTARVTAVPAALNIFDALTGEIPAWSAATNVVDRGDRAPGTPTIVRMRSGEDVQARDNLNSPRVQLMVQFKVQPGTPVDRVEARVRETGLSTPWRTADAAATAGTVTVEDVERDVEYDVQVRALRFTQAGVAASPWSDTSLHTVEATEAQLDTDNLAPGSTTALYSAGWSGSLALTGAWADVIPDGVDASVYRVTDTVLGTWQASLDVAAGAGDTLNVQVRMIDQDGSVVMPPRSVTPNTTATGTSHYSADLPSATETLTVTAVGDQTIFLQMISTGTATATLTAASLTVEDRKT
jgi:hypothetical protein